MTQRRTTTTSGGTPVGDNQNSFTVGSRDPVLMQDLLLIEKMAHFNRERISERVVHAKVSGAITGEMTISARRVICSGCLLPTHSNGSSITSS